MSVLAHAMHAVLELFPLHQQFNDELRKWQASWSELGVPAEYQPGEAQQ